MAQFSRGTNTGSEYQRSDNSFYKGIVVKCLFILCPFPSHLLGTVLIEVQMQVSYLRKKTIF